MHASRLSQGAFLSTLPASANPVIHKQFKYGSPHVLHTNSLDFYSYTKSLALKVRMCGTVLQIWAILYGVQPQLWQANPLSITRALYLNPIHSPMNDTANSTIQRILQIILQQSQKLHTHSHPPTHAHTHTHTHARTHACTYTLTDILSFCSIFEGQQARTHTNSGACAPSEKHFRNTTLTYVCCLPRQTGMPDISRDSNTRKRAHARLHTYTHHFMTAKCSKR